LAFQPNFPEEQTLPEILPDPLPVVATALSHLALERVWREHSLMRRRRRKYQRKQDLATIKARIAGSSSRVPRPLLALHGIDESDTYTSPTMLHASVTFRPQQNQM
jgi:hypothetical protein